MNEDIQKFVAYLGVSDTLIEQATKEEVLKVSGLNDAERDDVSTPQSEELHSRTAQAVEKQSENAQAEAARSKTVQLKCHHRMRRTSTSRKTVRPAPSLARE